MLTISHCLILPVLFCLANTHPSPSCGYKPPEANQVLTGVTSIKSSRHARSTEFDSLKILTYYDSTFQTQSNYASLKQVVDEGVVFWESVLKVRDRVSKFWMNRHCSGSQAHYGYNSTSGSFQYWCAGGCSTNTVCGYVTVPSDHLDVCRYYDNGPKESGTKGAGISGYNFVLYISANADSTRCNPTSSILAYAAHCQQEGSTDRPIAGYINFCPGAISSDYSLLQQAHFAAQHEILHALGFSISLFAYWRLPNGSPRTVRSSFTGNPNLGWFQSSSTGIFQWSNSTIIQRHVPWVSATGTHNIERYLIITERVVAEARKHFSCNSLEGVELENQGVLGTSLTHWEKRLLENELMTAAYTHRFAVSNITLAFLEDTGWYIPNYSKGQELSWGKGLGCDFAVKSCFSWFRNGTTSPYCQEYSAPGQKLSACSAHRRVKVNCNLALIGSTVSPEYQYFSSSVPPAYLSSTTSIDFAQLGGIYLSDYCPFPQEFVIPGQNGQSSRSSECFESRNQLVESSNLLQETYGGNSMCFELSGATYVKRCDKVYSYAVGSGCYKYVCSSLIGLSVVIAGQSYPCTSPTVNYDVNSAYYKTTGTIKCPECSSVCPVCPTSPVTTTPTPSNTVPCLPITDPSTTGAQNIVLNYFLIVFLLILNCHRFFNNFFI